MNKLTLLEDQLIRYQYLRKECLIKRAYSVKSKRVLIDNRINSLDKNINQMQNLIKLQYENKRSNF